MRHFPFINPVSIFRIFFLKIITLSTLALLITGCGEEPNFLGRNLLPSNENFELTVDTSIVIKAYTANAKPIITTRNNAYPIGAINSPVFGYSESKIVTQFGISTILEFGATPVIDSLFIFLRLNGFLGDSLAIQTLNVYELTEGIKTDSTYFSNNNMDGQYSPDPIGSTEFVANDTLIKISITNQSFINKFFTAPDSTFINTVKFKEFFKGLYFEVDAKTEYGGAISYVNLVSDDSKVILYYTEGVTLSKAYTMFFRGDVNSFNIFHNFYDNYPPSVNLNNPDSPDTVLFLTSMAGLNVHLILPELEKWKEKGEISIIKAELIVGVEDFVFKWNNSKFYPPALYLFYLNNEGNYNFIYDYNINPNGFGGQYLAQDKGYKFNIGHHLQSYINGKIDNFELVIIPERSNASANRVLLKSPLANDSKRMKIKVIYTKL